MNAYLKLFVDTLERCRKLNDAEFGRLIRAALSYQATGAEVGLTGREELLWDGMKLEIDRGNVKYAEQVAANAENGKKGGRPKKAKETENNRMGFCETEKSQEKEKEKDKEKDYISTPLPPAGGECGCGASGKDEIGNNGIDTANIGITGIDTASIGTADNSIANIGITIDTASIGITDNNTAGSNAIAETGDAFGRFWSAYPKKRGKGDAERAWIAINPDAELTAAILDGLTQAVTRPDWQRDNGRYIPYPAKWLRNRCWEDEPAAQTGRAGGSFEPDGFFTTAGTEHAGSSFETDDFFAAALALSYGGSMNP